MKKKYLKLLTISIFLATFLSSNAQVNDSIRILIFPFKVSGEVADTSLALKVADKLQESLERDFLFLNTDDITRLKIRSWTYKFRSQIEDSDKEILKLRAPNYYIKGTVYNDQLTVKIYRYPSNEQITIITQKWNLAKSRSFPHQPVEKVAEKIWKRLDRTALILEPRAKLLIKSDAPEAIVKLNGKVLGSIVEPRTVSLDGARYVRINIDGKEDLIRLEDRLINQVSIKKKGENYKIKRSRLILQLSSGVSRFNQEVSYSADLAVKLQLAKGVSFGAKTQALRLYHSYEYATLEGLAPIEQRQQTDILNFALIGSYERYSSSIGLLWHTDLYLIALPNSGGGIRTGFSLEAFPSIQLKLGYQWLDTTVSQAVFTPFGNATIEEINANFKGIYLGITYNLWL